MASLGNEATIMAHNAASEFGDGMMPEMAAAFGMNVGNVADNFDYAAEALRM